MHLEESSTRNKLKKLLKIERVNKKIAQEREAIKKKKDELADIQLSLKNSRDAVSLLIDIRDAIAASHRKKKKKETRISKKKYNAIKRMFRKKKR